jgi:hypothetical protein
LIESLKLLRRLLLEKQVEGREVKESRLYSQSVKRLLLVRLVLLSRNVRVVGLSWLRLFLLRGLGLFQLVEKELL